MGTLCKATVSLVVKPLHVYITSLITKGIQVVLWEREILPSLCFTAHGGIYPPPPNKVKSITTE